MLELLWNLNATAGQTFVIVTHNHTIAQQMDRTVQLVDGKVIDAETATEKNGAMRHAKTPHK